MTQSEKRAIRIKWVRSGIGFNHRQSEIIRSLGLRRLNHVVERPDTPQIRGLVAKVPHLVEIVNETTEARRGTPWRALTSRREYRVLPAEASSAAAPSERPGLPVSEATATRGESEHIENNVVGGP